MKFVICSSELDTCEMVKKEINLFCNKRGLQPPQINYYSSPINILENSSSFDVAFLDINITGASAIAAAHILKKTNHAIALFIIIDNDYYYLNKIAENDVFQCFSNNELRLCNSFKPAYINHMKSNCKIRIETKSGTFILHINDIVMVKTEKRKTIVQTVNKEYLTDFKVIDWKRKLPEIQFMETFKGVIVNFEHILFYDKEKITMDTANATAYISVRKYKEFKARYTIYTEMLT